MSTLDPWFSALSSFSWHSAFAQVVPAAVAFLVSYGLSRLALRYQRGRKNGTARVHFQVVRRKPRWYQIYWGALGSILDHEIVKTSTGALLVGVAGYFSLLRIESPFQPFLAGWGALLVAGNFWLYLRSCRSLVVGFENGVLVGGKYYELAKIEDVSVVDGKVRFQTRRWWILFDCADLPKLTGAIRSEPLARVSASMPRSDTIRINGPSRSTTSGDL